MEEYDVLAGSDLKGIKFYKFLGRDMTNRGFKFVEGLNVDINPFDTINECAAGGLYFCTDEHIPEWIHGYDVVADVTLPDDAKVIMLPKKCKADKIIISNVRHVSELKQFEDPAFCCRFADPKQLDKYKISPENRRICDMYNMACDNIEMKLDMVKIGTDLNDVTEEFCMKMMFNPVLIYRFISNPTKNILYRMLEYYNQNHISHRELVDIIIRIPSIDVAEFVDRFPKHIDAVGQKGLELRAVRKCAKTVCYIISSNIDMWEYACAINPSILTEIPDSYVSEKILAIAKKHDLVYNKSRYGRNDMWIANPEVIKQWRDKYLDFVSYVHGVLGDVFPFLKKIMNIDCAVIYGSIVRFCAEHFNEHRPITKKMLMDFLKNHDIDINIRKRIRTEYLDILLTLGKLEYMPFQLYTDEDNLQLDTRYVRYSRKGRYVNKSCIRKHYCYNLWVQFEGQWIKIDVSFGDVNINDYSVNAVMLDRLPSSKELNNNIIAYKHMMESISSRKIQMYGLDINLTLKQLYRIKKLLAAGYTLADDFKETMRDQLLPLMTYVQNPFVHCSVIKPGPSVPDAEAGRIYESKLDYKMITQSECLEDPDIKKVIAWAGLGDFVPVGKWI
jgi:hypothetical protein